MRTFALLCLAVSLCAFAPPAQAQNPFTSLVPFKRVDADPSKTYELTKAHGPWMILCSSFAGQGAEDQAKQLVLELRQRFKWKAYIHRHHFDFSKPVTGLGLNRYGDVKRMRHATGVEFDEIAVLVGNFDSVDSAELTKTLRDVKYAKPDCLDIKRNQQSTQRFAGIRQLQRYVSNDSDRQQRGPMASAFATRNPLLGDENYAVRTVDKMVLEMNKDAEHSLLKNPSKFTVKVATFSGASTIKPQEMEKLRSSSRSSLEDAGEKAQLLVGELRKKGVEAYVFHDRHESYVTVGSFESVGKPLPNGTQEINPAVYQVMQTYGASQKALPGQAVVGLQQKSLPGLKGIQFDVQAMPIEVPRVSIAVNYARNALE